MGRAEAVVVTEGLTVGEGGGGGGLYAGIGVRSVHWVLVLLLDIQERAPTKKGPGHSQRTSLERPPWPRTMNP